MGVCPLCRASVGYGPPPHQQLEERSHLRICAAGKKACPLCARPLVPGSFVGTFRDLNVQRTVSGLAHTRCADPDRFVGSSWVGPSFLEIDVNDLRRFGAVGSLIGLALGLISWRISADADDWAIGIAAIVGGALIGGIGTLVVYALRRAIVALAIVGVVAAVAWFMFGR
jgi:hypothetical protein